MPAPAPESLPAIVSAVRMLITSAVYAALSRRRSPGLPVAGRLGQRAPGFARRRGRAESRSGALRHRGHRDGGAGERHGAVDRGAVHVAADRGAARRRRARRPARHAEPGDLPGAGHHRRVDVRAVAGARAGAGAAARPDRRLPDGVSAGGVRRRTARRSRVDAHLGWRGRRDAGRPRGDLRRRRRLARRCSAGPSALGPLAAFVAVDLVKVAVAAAVLPAAVRALGPSR